MCNHALKMQQAKEARAMYEAGQSLAEIGEHFGVTPFAVKSAIRAAGGTIRTKAEGTRLTHGVWIEYGGKRLTISEWARELGKPRATLASRWQAGKPITEILR